MVYRDCWFLLLNPLGIPIMSYVSLLIISFVLDIVSKYSSIRLNDVWIYDYFSTHDIYNVAAESLSLLNKKSWLLEIVFTSLMTRSKFNLLCTSFLASWSFSYFFCLIKTDCSFNWASNCLTLRDNLTFYPRNDFI